MKTLCGVLICLLLLHLQCGGSCLTESLDHGNFAAPRSEEPPCHQHSQSPTNNPQPSRHAEGTCTQGPLISAKLSFGKVVLESHATLPDTLGTSQPSDFELRRYTPVDPQILAPPP